ncbi:hypothetical protein [Actinomadura sp. 6N118]|uniref:hypothetical protein n=1 Tax=Actinomadura sp. 6N118 TaxID=3375151 RepID=UPI0037B8EC4C
MRQMLYYPGTYPPETALFQAVLYWDSIASIAPVEWREHAAREGGQPLLFLHD